MDPLHAELAERRREWIVALDSAYDHKGMGKVNKEKLADLICLIVEDFVPDSGDADEELTRLLDKHAGQVPDFDTEGDALFEQMFEEKFGFLKDVFGDEVAAAPDAEPQPEPGPWKDAPKSAREERAEAQEAKLKQSVREIYRKLVSALHPDREQDPVARDRKTALMQRVNSAYEANDFLGLLELQIEIDQIDLAGLDRMDEQRIKDFNAVLSRQVAELSQEVIAFEFGLAMDFRLPLDRRLTPKNVRSLLDADLADLRRALNEVARNVQIAGDIKQLKTWLRAYRMSDEFDDEVYW